MNTHWRKVDYRIESLTFTIQALENSILKLQEKLEEFEWYDCFCLIKESEPIYGLVFISFQNYINSSIYDRFSSLNEKNKKYKLGKILNNYQRTDIELIIGLANYFKHRDDNNKFHKGTIQILNDFNFRYDENIDTIDSPIFKGLSLFSETWELAEILKVVQNWRDKIWR